MAIVPVDDIGGNNKTIELKETRLEFKDWDVSSTWMTGVLTSGSTSLVSAYANVSYKYSSSNGKFSVGPLRVKLRRDTNRTTGVKIKVESVSQKNGSGFALNNLTGYWQNFMSSYTPIDTLSDTGSNAVWLSSPTTSLIDSTEGAKTGYSYITVKIGVYNSQNNHLRDVYIYISLSLSAGISSRTLSFNSNGGSAVSSKTKYYGTIEDATWTSSKSSNQSNYDYSVTFYRNNDSSNISSYKYYDKIKTNQATLKTTYSLKYWTYNGATYGGSDGTNQTYKYTENITLKAIWNESTTGANATLSLKSIPQNPGLIGWLFKGWFTEKNGSGNQVKVGSSFTNDSNAYSYFTPKSYKILFDLNGGKIPDGYDQKIANYTIYDKIYGTTSNAWRTPDFEPKKVGYKFNGWSNKDGTLTKLNKNSNITDIYYNAINTESTNNNVTLYAQWILDPNTIKFNYYIKNGSSYTSYTDEESYNITMTQFVKGAPSRDMPGDYVFIGWCDKIPNNWNNPQEENNGYRGVYTLPINAPSSVLPVIVDISKLTTLEDWGRSGNLSEQYYGIWAKTGKYIKINGAFRKVNTAYVKIDGVWKPITDIWTCVDSSSSNVNTRWKHEI